CTQTIIVMDTHAPTITCPANTTIDCAASTDPSNTGSATATDDCSGVALISHVDALTPGNCVGNYTISRTWTATHNCSNSSNRYPYTTPLLALHSDHHRDGHARADDRLPGQHDD